MEGQNDFQVNPSRESVELGKIRTRLANKRTFLAWCRTSLAFMGFGFLLEKLDVFLANQHRAVTEALLQELGTLGKFTFIVGPLLILFAGVRYYALEKQLGFDDHAKFILPEMVLMVCILGAALIYTLS